MDYSQAFQVLSIKPPFDEKKLKQAYLSLAKTHHPDAGGTHEKFVTIGNAYELLKNSIYLFDNDEWNSAKKSYQNPFGGSVHGSVDDFVNDFMGKAYRSAHERHKPDWEARRRNATRNAQYYQNNEVKYKPSEPRKIPKTQKGFVKFWRALHRVVKYQLKVQRIQKIPSKAIGEMIERKLKIFELEVCPVKNEWFLGALKGQFYREVDHKRKKKYHDMLLFIAPEPNTRHEWAQKYFQLEFGHKFV